MIALLSVWSHFLKDPKNKNNRITEDDGNVLYLDHDNGCTAVYLSENYRTIYSREVHLI